MLTTAAVALALAVTGIAVAAPASGHMVIISATAVGGHPSVSWTVSPGWCSNIIAVADSSEVGSDGSFFGEHLIDGGALTSAQTSWLSSDQSTSKPGTYYVRVQGYACDFSDGPEWSETATFTVQPPPPPAPRPPAGPPKVRLSIANVVGKNLTGAARGQTIEISSDVRASDPSASDWLLRGKVCVRRTTSPLCKDNFIITKVTRAMEVNGRIRAYALLDGKILASKSIKVTKRPTSTI